MDLCDFGSAKLFTDRAVSDIPEGLEVIPVQRLDSARAYSRFVLRDLPAHVGTSHALVVQWDGFVVRPEAWDPAFLKFDYIGALWPQFSDGASVGNGGFSLRSKHLMEACLAIGAEAGHPEDVTICRLHRDRLERDYELVFADPSTAARFSYERTLSNGREFGFHGVFNMPAHLPADEWWQIYLGLDDASSVFYDLWMIVAATWNGSRSFRRTAKLAWDAALARLGVKR